MRRGLAMSLCALSVTFCTAPASFGDEPRAAGCERRGGPSQPGDRSDLGRAQVVAMLDDLRTTLLDRYGVDEREFDTGRRRARLVVPVRFHVITDGRAGRLSSTSVRRQIAALNSAYGGRRGGANTGVRFRLVSTKATNNRAWFRQPERHERPLKKALRRGGPGTLNLFTAAVGADVLGFSTFPHWYRENPGLDGVVVDYRTLPGGSYRHYDKGMTTVHEVGHWLGLFHTFENGCLEPGDGVADTPYEAGPAEGCPWIRDSCAQRGLDPVHNFMNYGWDDCMREFTPGQGRRIRAAWAAYRRPSGVRSVAGAR
ncbi:zinc metalloprotease [Spirillospora sp. CA-294931]|uniref:zinc metalloprotease n=1 Tax=Spirillospora sp. CA-294931 TaxID=3240042 RepID=UPI003D8BB653